MNSEITFQEVFEKEDFDPSKTAPSAPFTQAFFYGEWQKAVGRKVSRFLIKRDSVTVGFAQLVVFNLPFNKKCVYAPYGPVFTESFNEEVFKKICASLRSFILLWAKRENVVFVRLDFSLSEHVNIAPQFFQDFFKKPTSKMLQSSFMQPRSEWYIDVSGSEDEIFNSFHKNTRYSVRVAKKNNVTTRIVESTGENFLNQFENFYTVLSETSKRDNFHLHPKNYYRNIFESCVKEKNAALVLSSHNDKLLAANLLIFYGDTAMFLFGGTRSEHRDVMPAYAAQWSTIKYLKSKNYHWYNLGGISDDKKWKGFSHFKKRFGGKAVDHLYSYDLVIKPVSYFFYFCYRIVVS